MILQAFNVGSSGTVLRVTTFSKTAPKVGGFPWRKMLGCDYSYQANIKTPRRKCFISRKIKESGKKWESGSVVNIRIKNGEVEVVS